MKHLRINHYAYIVLTAVLVIFCGYNFISSLIVAKADVTPVTITSPTPNQQLYQGPQTISGTGPALKQVTVLDGDQKIGTTTTQANGSWSLAWDNQLPGAHNLKAVAATGSLYRSQIRGINAVQNTDINSGQITQNYPAGLAVSVGMVYDSSVNKAYVINDPTYRPTISVIDPSTQTVTDTIVYSQTFSPADKPSLHAYQFDQTRKRLYLADFFNVYVVDTQAKSVVATIPYEGLNNSYIINLALDPEGNFLYLQNNNDGGINRINLQSNTLDTAWRQLVGDGSFTGVLPGVNGDVYLQGGANQQQVYNGNNGTIEQLNIDQEDCNSGAAAAMSKDYKKLYIPCGTGPSDATIVAYSTETASVVGSFEYNYMLTYGQLLGDYLLLNGDPEASSIRVINTVTNTEEPAISGFNGSFDFNSGITSLNTRFIAFADDQLYFLTRDDTNWHLNTANLSTGQLTDQQQYDPLNSFSSIARLEKLAGDNDVVLLLPGYANHIIGLDAQSGSQELISYGMGNGLKVFHHPGSSRIFSLGLMFYQGESNIISVGDTNEGSYETSISLPTNVAITGGQLSKDGATLYVMGTTREIVTYYPESTANKVYAINTATLAIERIYSSLPDDDDIYNSLPAAVVHNSKLYFGIITDNCTKLYQLDLEDDVTASDTIGECQTNNSYFSAARAPVIAVNNNGTNVAFVTDEDKVSIYETQTLDVARTVTVQHNTQQFAIATISGINFDTQGNLLVGSGGYSTIGVPGIPDTVLGETSPLYKYRVSDGVLLTTTQIPVNVPSITAGSKGYSICSLTHLPTNQNNYSAANNSCVQILFQGSQPTYEDILTATRNDTTSIVDTTTNTVVSSYETSGQFNFDAGGIANTVAQDVTVSSASQTVTILGAGVDIVSPADNVTINAGARAITGAGLPSSTVSVTVDGVAIGTADTNEFGAWSLEHNFTTTGQHVIRAEQTQPDREIVYLNSRPITGFGALENSTEQGQTLYGVDAESRQIIATIKLPGDFRVGTYQLSSDKSKLYVLGFNTSITKIFTVSTSSNTIIDSKTIGDYVVSAADYNFPYFVVSPDNQKLYVIKHQDDASNLVEFSVATGAELRRIELDSDAVSTGAAGGLPISWSAFTQQGGHLMLQHCSFCSSGSGLYDVDLTSGTASFVASPGSSKIIAIRYDDTDDRLYTLLFNGTNLQLVASDGSDGTVAYTQTLPSNLPLPINMLLSGDGDTIYLPITLTNTSRSGIIVVNAADGNFVVHESTLPAGSTIAEFNGNIGLSANSNYSKIYISHYNPSSGPEPQVLTDVYSLVDDSFTARSGSTPLFMAEGEPLSSIGNSFAMLATGVVSDDTHTVTVQAASPPTTTTPSTQPPVKIPDIIKLPTTPAVINPEATTGQVQLLSQPRKQTAAGKIALQQAEKALTRVSMFTKARLSLQAALLKVPRPIVNSLPYFLLLMLLVLAGYYLYQTQRQLGFERRLQALFKKQKVLSEEKRNFLELTSHYLRTPLTYIKAGSEMITKALPTNPASTELAESVNHLGLFVESLIEESTTAPQPDNELLTKPVGSAWLSKNFLLPLTGFMAALGLFYLSFVGIAGLRYAAAVYITQLLVAFLVVQLFYGMYKNHQRVMAEEAYLSSTLKAEAALDDARSKLLRDAGEQLQTRTQHLTGIIGSFKEDIATNKRIITQGVERLQELSRTFLLVSQLEARSIDAKLESVSVRDLAALVIEPFTEQIKAKKLHLTMEGFDSDVVLTTNKPFADLTLRSLIENAIQASQENDRLTIKCMHSGEHVAFQVIDHGEGIPKEKLSQLFKPFVRVGPVTTFNREGIGLSLFIDRLVMHALGGDIEIASQYKHGTRATLVFRQLKASKLAPVTVSTMGESA